MKIDLDTLFKDFSFIDRCTGFWKSVIFHILLTIIAFCESIYFLPMGIFVDKKYIKISIMRGIKMYYYFSKKLGINIVIRGKENIPKDSRCLMVSKHQSSLDGIVFYELIDEYGDISVILKKSLIYKIPIYGIHSLIYGHIFIDRTNALSSMKKIMKDVNKYLLEGRNIAIYPEGTRVKPGEEGDYKAGVYLIYKKCGIPVVPIALNTGLCYPKLKFRKLPGNAVVEFLKPIEPGLKKEEFLNKLKNVIEKNTRRLEKEWLDDFEKRKLLEK